GGRYPGESSLATVALPTEGRDQTGAKHGGYQDRAGGALQGSDGVGRLGDPDSAGKKIRQPLALDGGQRGGAGVGRYSVASPAALARNAGPAKGDPAYVLPRLSG